MTPTTEATRYELIDIIIDWAMSGHLSASRVSSAEVDEDSYNTINDELQKRELPWDWVTLHKVIWQGPEEPKQKPFVLAWVELHGPHVEHAFYIVQGSRLIAHREG